MATLKISDKLVTVELDWWEKLAAHRSHLTVPVRLVTSVDVVEDVFSLSAVSSASRTSATRIKGLTSVGTVDDGEGDSAFVACRRGSGESTPGIVLCLDNATVSRIVVSSPKAENYAQKLQAVIAAGDE